MKKIIVTGGLGFIGSNLIKILNEKNFFIINIDKISYASNKNNIPNNIKNYKFYKENINNKDFIVKILKKYKPSLIFNLAAETHVDKSIDGPKSFINSNILGVFNLLEAIRIYKKKIKLIISLPLLIVGQINKALHQTTEVLRERIQKILMVIKVMSVLSETAAILQPLRHKIRVILNKKEKTL